MACIFCKIAAGELPAAAVYQSPRCFAFLDLQPCAAGHTVIVPKAHVVNLVDLSAEDGVDFLATTQAVVRLLTAVFDTTDFTIGINEGRLAGRAIDHLHLHVIPRFAGDGGGSLHSIVQNSPTESLEVIQAKIAAVGR